MTSPTRAPLESWRVTMDPIEGEWWTSAGVYLSDVCLAVHLVPRGNVWREEVARDELRALLRWINFEALELDLMRPVAGVIPRDPDPLPGGFDPLRVARWTSDQDWHRGGFTLYVEDRDGEWSIEDRLRDLLAPEPEVLYDRQPMDSWDAHRTMQRLKARWTTTAEGGDGDDLGLQDLHAALAAFVGVDRPARGDRSAIDSWVRATSRRAHRLAEEVGP